LFGDVGAQENGCHHSPDFIPLLKGRNYAIYTIPVKSMDFFLFDVPQRGRLAPAQCIQ
jgi:hypothetical protein